MSVKAAGRNESGHGDVPLTAGTCLLRIRGSCTTAQHGFGSRDSFLFRLR